MDLRIQAIHFDATEKLEGFIQKKADKLVRRYADITNFDVTLKVVKPETAMNKNAVVKVTVPQQADIVADKTADSFEEAVDLAIEAVEHQLARRKDK